MAMRYYRQETNYTCGPASMRMALEYVGIKKNEKLLARLLRANRIYGTSNKAFPRVAERYRLSYVVERNGTLRDLKHYLRRGYAIILSYFYMGWSTKSYGKVYHYAVLEKIKGDYIYLLDPWFGPHHKHKYENFKRFWKSNPKTEDGDRHWFIAIEK